MSQAGKSVLDRNLPALYHCTVVVVAAFLLRQAISHYLGVQLPPFITFYPAAMVVALLAGLWTGVYSYGAVLCAGNLLYFSSDWAVCNCGWF